jgi:hypothetical protein
MSLRNQTRNVTIIITVVLLIGLSQYTQVEATLPEEIQLTYQFGTQTLTVNVSHYVPNIKTHYIENIEVLKNGLSILNRSYSNQSFNWGMLDTFSVSAAIDDNLTVNVLCSKGYPLTTWLIVTSTTATNPQPTETTSTTEHTATTEPYNGPESPGASLGTSVAIIAGVGVVVFLIVFFAWLQPGGISETFKQLGSRIRAGFVWFGEKMSNLFQQIKTKIPPKKS